LFTPFGTTTSDLTEFCSGQNANHYTHCEALSQNTATSIKSLTWQQNSPPKCSPKAPTATPPNNGATSSALLDFSFKRCAEDFKLIDDYPGPIIIPYGKKGTSLCQQAEQTFDPLELRNLARKLRRDTNAIPKSQHALLLKAGILKPLHDNRFFLLNSTPHYDSHFGLHPHPNLMMSPSSSIVSE
jgi:hypothetical protein